MVGHYREIGGIEFHPVKSKWAEKEFIRALDVINIPGHIVAWVCSQTLLLRNKMWYCAKFTSQYNAENAFRKVVSEGRKWAKERDNTEDTIPPDEGARPFELIIEAYQWLVKADRELFSTIEAVLPGIPDFGDSRVFHVPSAIRYYYVRTPKHIWRVIGNHSSLFTQRYERTLGREAFLDCLLEDREFGPPFQKWKAIVRHITEVYPDIGLLHSSLSFSFR